MNKIRLAIIAAVVLLLAGLTLGWYIYRSTPPPPEVAAPEVVQEDGSKVLEKKPDPKARPAHKVPKDATVERIVKVFVAPDAPLADGSVEPECPALDVDLTLVRLPDETRRVIASSPNGKVVGGVDIPVEGAVTHKALKWAAGLTANPFDNTFGVFLDRDIGPFRVGAEANQIKDGFDLRLKAGMRF